MRGFKGVTLIELLVVLAIIAIALAWAMPHFGTMINKTRVTTTANDLVGAIAYARSLAVRNGRASVTICANDGPDECDAVGNWNAGFMLFTDSNSNKTREPGEAINRRWEAVQSPVTLAANVLAVTFKTDGTASPDTGALFIICDPTGKTSPRSVRVWGSGANNLYSPQTCVLP